MAKASALQRLTVVDLSSHLSGPYCAMLLADHGADVIKIERPDGGDDARRMPPFVGGESAPFMIWNRNKRSVVIDLKTEAGKAQLLQLIDGADVLIENFRPGTLDRLGLGWPTLSARNPRLIYAAISGFGQTGPYRERGGFDLITQGMSGLMSVTGPKDGPPHRMPIAISDVAAGMHLAVGVLAALEARHHTGRGQLVETSLLESAMSYGVYEAAHVAATGERPPRLGQAHRGSSPYQVFPTADGWITVGAAQTNFWTRLCDLHRRSRAQGGPALCHQCRSRPQQRGAGGADRAPAQGEAVRPLARRRWRRWASPPDRCSNSRRRWPIPTSSRAAWWSRRSIRPPAPSRRWASRSSCPTRLAPCAGRLRGSASTQPRCSTALRAGTGIKRSPPKADRPAGMTRSVSCRR